MDEYRKEEAVNQVPLKENESTDKILNFRNNKQASAGDNIIRLQQNAGNRAVVQMLSSSFADKQGTADTSDILQEIHKRFGNTIQKKENETGLPDKIKGNLENLSGESLDNVKVHYNSPEPTALGALAYTQGNDIHVAAGQEKHLPHEAWHVIQQRQGRVRPTSVRANIALNDDKALESEADSMGLKASNGVAQLRDAHMGKNVSSNLAFASGGSEQVIQCKYKAGDCMVKGVMTSVWSDDKGKLYNLINTTIKGEIAELKFQSLDDPKIVQSFEIPMVYGNMKLLSIDNKGAVYQVLQAGIAKSVLFQDLTQLQNNGQMSAFAQIKEGDLESAYHGTTFVSRVSLVPLNNATNDEIFTSDQMMVTDVKAADDRPPTKFGSGGQFSHTVAWSLLREAMQGLKGQPLNRFIATVKEMFDDILLPPDGIGYKDSSRKQKTANPHGAASTLQSIVNDGINKINVATLKGDFAFWQRAASELIEKFVHLYQISDEATYYDGPATGHNEAGKMDSLREKENYLQGLAQGQKDIIKANLDKNKADLDNVINNAYGMLDIKVTIGVKNLSSIYHQWSNDLCLAFPNVMYVYGDKIIEFAKTPGKFVKSKDKNGYEILKDKPYVDEKALKAAYKDGTKDPFVANDLIRTKANAGGNFAMPFKTALPAAIQSTLAANVVVTPNDIVNYAAPNTLGLYNINQLNIDQLQIADDRPETRSGKQQSHTVPWTLIRNHFMSFKGKTVKSLFDFISGELNILQNFISNSKVVEETKSILISVESLEKSSCAIPQWQIMLSELVESYVTLYQRTNFATYYKEDNPRPHGEHDAIKYLETAEDQLAAGKDTEKTFMELILYSRKLLDADVGNVTLSPQNWKNAVSHWEKLMIDHFPKLAKHIGNYNGGDKVFLEAAKANFTVSEDTLKPLETRKAHMLFKIYDYAVSQLEFIPFKYQEKMEKFLKSINGEKFAYKNEDSRIVRIIPGTFVTRQVRKDLRTKTLPRKFPHDYVGDMTDFDCIYEVLREFSKSELLIYTEKCFSKIVYGKEIMQIKSDTAIRLSIKIIDALSGINFTHIEALINNMKNWFEIIYKGDDDVTSQSVISVMKEIEKTRKLP